MLLMLGIAEGANIFSCWHIANKFSLANQIVTENVAQ